MPHPTLVTEILDREIDIAAERFGHRGVRLQRDGCLVKLWLPGVVDGTAICLTGDNYDTEPFSLTVIDIQSQPVPESMWPHGLAHGTIHPVTHQPFACLQGLKEYFNHPSHSNECWDQYRGRIRLVDLVSHILNKVTL